jgi:DNA-binding winged helix-turn-helix (wHTH) protein
MSGGVLVEESNLTVQVAGLRKVLGKEVVKTVPGVGYKFTLGADSDSAPMPQLLSVLTRPRGRAFRP